MSVIAAIGTAVGVLVTFGVLGGGSGAPAPSEALGAAASKTSSAGSSRLSVTITQTGAAGKKIIRGLGAFDYDDGRGEMEYDYRSFASQGGLTRVDVIFNGPSYYVHGLSATGENWLRVDYDALANADPSRSPALAQLSQVKFEDPTKAVGSLEELGGGVKKIGAETTFGFPTTHYRALSDPDGGGPKPATTIDVWVEDEDEYLRKVETTSQEGPSTVTTTTELYEFGVHVKAPVPPLSEQVPYEDLPSG